MGSAMNNHACIDVSSIRSRNQQPPKRWKTVLLSTEPYYVISEAKTRRARERLRLSPVKLIDDRVGEQGTVVPRFQRLYVSGREPDSGPVDERSDRAVDLISLP